LLNPRVGSVGQFTFAAYNNIVNSIELTLSELNRVNAESVRKFQPRVALWQPWESSHVLKSIATLKGLRYVMTMHIPQRNPFRVASNTNLRLIPRVAKAQPWAGIRERFQRCD